MIFVDRASNDNWTDDNDLADNDNWATFEEGDSKQEGTTTKFE